MVSDATIKLATFSILLNIIFPVFAYSFTTLEGSDFISWDLSIDQDDLINAGIQFERATQDNITFRDGPITFNISNDYVRFNWERHIFQGDRMTVKQPSFIEQAWGDITGDYFSLGGEEAVLGLEGSFIFTGEIFNSTIVTHWDPVYNWTRIDLKNQGVTALITPRITATDPNNITEAVYVDGTLTITLGSIRASDGSFDGGDFIDFYWDMLIGANEWGLPASMEWIIRILTAMTVFSAVLLGREILNPLA